MQKKLEREILKAQSNEITEHIIYKRLAGRAKGSNKEILEKISLEEISHYNFWKNFTHQEVSPSQLRVSFFYFLARFFGLNFGVKLMEKGESLTQDFYQEFKELDPATVDKIINEEKNHEQKIIAMIDQKELQYTGSIVLGLNDALVELTGALAGLTLALGQTRLIAVVGLITGIAASLSMAGSEYLSTKEEGTKEPLRSSIYTGIAYILAVIVLILPYFFLASPFTALAVVVTFALAIIFVFTFYVSVAKELSFKKRFLEMAAISLGVAILNFFIGFLVKKFLKVEI